VARRYYDYRVYSLIVLIYLVIGVFVSLDRGYLTVPFLKTLLSVLLSILLWFLVLLGVDLHIR
jgi:hypothetical protein